MARRSTGRRKKLNKSGGCGGKGYAGFGRKIKIKGYKRRKPGAGPNARKTVQGPQGEGGRCRTRSPRRFRLRLRQQEHRALDQKGRWRQVPQGLQAVQALLAYG